MRPPYEPLKIPEHAKRPSYTKKGPGRYHKQGKKEAA